MSRWWWGVIRWSVGDGGGIKYAVGERPMARLDAAEDSGFYLLQRHVHVIDGFGVAYE